MVETRWFSVCAMGPRVKIRGSRPAARSMCVQAGPFPKYCRLNLVNKIKFSQMKHMQFPFAIQACVGKEENVRASICWANTIEQGPNGITSVKQTISLTQEQPQEKTQLGCLAQSHPLSQNCIRANKLCWNSGPSIGSCFPQTRLVRGQRQNKRQPRNHPN